MFPFLHPFGPDQASENALHYDILFWVITALSVLFTLIVLTMVAVLAVKYRRGSSADRRNPISHSGPLEILWSGIPLVLALGIFVWSASDFVRVRQMPKESTEIFVIGKQWMWHLQHMNGIRENNELHIPVGTAVKMTMISQDVIHAMYLPEMRAQYHVVPGRYTNLYFTPIKTGKFKMLCAMHCGTQHSEMVGTVYVLSPADYVKWLENNGVRNKPIALNMAEAGRQVYAEKGCANCHTNVNNERGPSLVGIFGTTRNFTDGTKIDKADEDYLRESIVDPWNRITKGYENTMPGYKGQLSEEQVLQLISYIKTMSPSNAKDGLAPYQRNDLPGTESSSTGRSSATDTANKKASAGAAQFRESESRP